MAIFGFPFGNPQGFQQAPLLPQLMRQQLLSPSGVPGPVPIAPIPPGGGPVPIPGGAPQMTPGFRAGPGMGSLPAVAQPQGFQVPEIGGITPLLQRPTPAPGTQGNDNTVSPFPVGGGPQGPSGGALAQNDPSGALSAGVNPSDYNAVFGGPMDPLNMRNPLKINQTFDYIGAPNLQGGDYWSSQGGA